eukprot:s3841_g17.t1
MVEDDPQVAEASFVTAGLYDTCESKLHVKNGDSQWKPHLERREVAGVLSASEAKQFWLEKEVQSLRSALQRVSVPTAFHESGYWNGGFESKVEPPCRSRPPVAPCRASDLGEVALQRRALHAVPSLQDRASAGASVVPDGVRAAYLHGEHLERDRALDSHGADLGGVRAAQHGDVCERIVGLCTCTMAIFATVGHPLREVFIKATASFEHGGHREEGRARHSQGRLLGKAAVDPELREALALGNAKLKKPAAAKKAAMKKPAAVKVTVKEKGTKASDHRPWLKISKTVAKKPERAYLTGTKDMGAKNRLIVEVSKARSKQYLKVIDKIMLALKKENLSKEEAIALRGKLCLENP